MNLTGRHSLTEREFSLAELHFLVDRALRLKKGSEKAELHRKVMAMLFFAPSLRTRTSFEAAMVRLGGHAINLRVGEETYVFEHRDGVVMDGRTQEHVREAAKVISRYADVIGMRKCELITTKSTSAEVSDSWEELKKDEFMHAFAEQATVPVISMESNAYHPCQGLADMVTLKEKLGDPRGKKYLFTWAYHPKSLPLATPHSQVLAACAMGMNVTVLAPEGWTLDPEVTAFAKKRAEEAGGGLRESHDQAEAYRGAHVVCCKSWGRIDHYGRFEEEAEKKKPFKGVWIVDGKKMARTDGAIFMHCLPVRRNVKVTDEVLDSKASVVIDQAENRMWAQMALLVSLVSGARA
jgi:N-acetylornithine carbamoyltransferase